MSKTVIVVLKTALHLLCLAPFAWLLHLSFSGALGLYADPVNYITHFTGDWTLYTLFASLAITPIRRLSPKLAWLIRFRRLLGLYAFFYTTLHLATYIFLFSGYDVTTALAGQPGRAEVRYLAKDGSEKVCYILTQPRYQGGTIIGTLSLLVDVTRERQLERVQRDDAAP